MKTRTVIAVLRRWVKTPRERWYRADFRSVLFGWIVGAGLLAWGLQGLAQSPSREVLLDVLKLVAGLVLLLWTVLWVLRPVEEPDHDEGTDG